jgi:hypothetical protein
MQRIPKYPPSSMYTQLLRRRVIQTTSRNKPIKERQLGSGSGTGTVESRLTSICPKSCNRGIDCTPLDAGNANTISPPVTYNGGNANSNFSNVLNSGNFCE